MRCAKRKSAQRSCILFSRQLFVFDLRSPPLLTLLSFFHLVCDYPSAVRQIQTNEKNKKELETKKKPNSFGSGEQLQARLKLAQMTKEKCVREKSGSTKGLESVSLQGAEGKILKSVSRG